MTGKRRAKRRVKRQDWKAVRLLTALLVILTWMIQLDSRMDFVYAQTQMPDKDPVLEGDMLYITRKMEAGPEAAGAGMEAGQAAGAKAGTAAGQTADAQAVAGQIADAQSADAQAADTQTADAQAVPDIPPESYWDRNGREYVLDHYEVKEIPGHMVGRVLEKQVVYSDVEGAEGLPESISVTEEVSGIPAEGELYIRDSRIVREEWRDGFQAPVLFHSYGADEYQTGSLVISGEDVLASAVESQEGILEVMGLSPQQYRIHSMAWDGEAFEDEDGQLCRRAMAEGQKLVRDYEITYEGEVAYMEPVSYEMEMAYRPVLPSRVWLDEEGTDTVAGEVAQEPSTTGEGGPLWYWVRSGFVITVGAGLIGICAGVLALAVSWLRQRKKEQDRKYLPDNISG